MDKNQPNPAQPPIDADMREQDLEIGECIAQFIENGEARRLDRDDAACIRRLIAARELTAGECNETVTAAQGVPMRVLQCPSCPTSVETQDKREFVPCLRCGAYMEDDATAKPSQPIEPQGAVVDYSNEPDLPDYFAYYVGVRLDQKGEVVLDLLVDPGPAFVRSGEKEPLYTAKQVRDYARSAIAALPVAVGAGEVDDAMVEAVESAVGMGHSAWDMVDPKEIIRASRIAAWNTRTATPQAPGADTPGATTEGE